MSWSGLLLLIAALMAVFVLWDLVFCHGQRCRELAARVFELQPWRFRRGRRPPR